METDRPWQLRYFFYFLTPNAMNAHTDIKFKLKQVSKTLEKSVTLRFKVKGANIQDWILFYRLAGVWNAVRCQ